MASTKNDPPTTIIKSDRAGRPRYSQNFKDEVLAAYAASGMSGPAFAGHCGLKYPTFAGWVAKRRGGNTEAAGDNPRFVLAEFGANTAQGGGLQVELPGGASARLADAAQADLLAALIRALAR